MSQHYDLFSEFTYDPRTKRYRVVEGSGKGSFVSKQAFLAQTEKFISSQTEVLGSYSKALFSGEIDITEFQNKVAKTLKEIHISQSILANKGVENMDKSAYGRVGSQLKKQYYSGKDRLSGDRFGLKYLVKDILAGKVSEAQLRARLLNYGVASKLTYHAQIDAISDKPFTKRVLGLNHNHCSECLSYAAMGVQPKGSLPLIGERCSCRFNCLCKMLYLSFEEAVLEGWESETK